MGQGQSQNEATEDAPTKADYYDLLGVDRNASEEELKKAYRRKALELHPDRNYGNVEHATRLFAEIQTAYEVLSDPQERAWYDSHRDVLLRGDQGGEGGDEFSYNIRMTNAVEIKQLMLRFNGKLEFTDAPSGFYGGLSEFFKQLAKEEDIACQWEDEDPMDYPDFGSKDDSYEDVVRPFYLAWTGFATRKSYAWKDQYRLSDAPDRRIRRLMEKENKKLREDAVQEYNDAVRSLLAFVRKRDPRVANNQKSEAERQKILRDAAAAQRARSKAAHQARIKNLDASSTIPDWAQSRTKDDHEGGFSSDSEIEEHEYDCIVCDKTFKSEAQYTVHEKSKKHIKLLKQLQREMKEEDVQINDQEEAEPGGQDSEDKQTPEEAVKDDAVLLTTTGEGPEEGENGAQPLRGDDPLTNGHAVPLQPPSAPLDDSDDADDDDGDYAPREALEERLGSRAEDILASELADSNLESSPAVTDTDSASHPKLGKAKQRRAKKAAQQASGVTSQQGSEFRCTRCGADFSSKTKLFAHLKEQPTHAALVSQMKASKGGKGKKR
jgi:DnaJ homolog subfamily A member 5